ncbi:hypothetical protein [Nonomuraea sp. SBT364]|uniref:hypothetical protein n=1 Tax=Nonomuraea sp. SBT364 TaxID=1580530 RepID=UPI00066E8D3B|nr:hypothetical protein [Nonomuraea sp. SBT364]
MPSLTIALEEGFSGERVTILLDGVVVFDRAGVRTRTQLGSAHTFTVEVEPGAHRVQARAPQAGEPVSVEADPATAPVVRVSRQAAGLRIDADDTPLRYM